MASKGIVNAYANLIEAGRKTIEDVPEPIQAEVRAELDRRAGKGGE